MSQKVNKYHLNILFKIIFCSISTTTKKSITINAQICSKFGNNISRREVRIKSGTSWELRYVLNNLKETKETFDSYKTISLGRFQIRFYAKKRRL